MIKSFNLATTVERYKYALETIDSIYNQADIIRVYLNDFNQMIYKTTDTSSLIS